LVKLKVLVSLEVGQYCVAPSNSTLLVSKLIKTILESDTAANKFVPICKVKASIHSAFNLIVC
jgi:hypothetical protein